MRAKTTLIVALAFAAGLMFGSGAIQAQGTADAKTPIRIQLKWFHQFQFAGYYAALEKGYFAEVGLDVQLVEGGPTTDPAHAVTFGEAEFGVGNSTLILDRARGMPLVAVAAIFQHSPFVLLARREPGLETVRDLEGRTLMAEEHAAELFAYLKLAGVDIDKIEIVPHTGVVQNLARDDPSGIDAATIYTTTEPYEAIRLNIPYRIFNPREITIDFYGDTLFTTDEFARSHPETVRKLREAVVRGWSYALSHQEEMISLILEKYEPKIGRLQLGFEAQTIHDLMAADIVDIGYMSSARWRQIADVFVEAEMLDAGFSLEGFLYEEEVETDPQFFWWVAVLATIAALGLALAHRFWRLNQRLEGEVRAKEDMRADLERLATSDALTGLGNRRELSRWAKHEIARVRRQGGGLALMLVDLDGFKQINDKWGHEFGDRALRLTSSILSDTVRDIDLAARIGGDEFVCLLADADEASAETVKLRLRRMFKDAGLKADDGTTVELAASIGIATLRSEDRGLDDIMRRADEAMYEEKQRHRTNNR